MTVTAQQARVLVVADWTVDPHEVVATCSRRAEAGGASFVVTVPAWLHGLDWAGDPTASAPCAQRQLETLARLSVAAGLDVDLAGVGDADVMSAIGDALDAHPATEILLFTRRRHLAASNPLDLVHRARRLTRLPVGRIAVPAVRGPRGRHGWTLLRGGNHCDADVLRAA